MSLRQVLEPWPPYPIRDMSQCSPDVVSLCRGPLTQLTVCRGQQSWYYPPAAGLLAPATPHLLYDCLALSSNPVALSTYPYGPTLILVTSLPCWLVSFSVCKIPAETFYLQSPYAPPTFRPPCFPFHLLPCRSWQVPQKGGLGTWTPEGQDGGAMRETVLNCA